MGKILDRQLSEHLKWSEVRCKGHGCCNGGGIVVELWELFERIRSQVTAANGTDTPITITSGFRCEQHNREVGGKSASPHMGGLALDLACPDGMRYETFYHICDALNPNGGVGKYSHRGFVHVDVRQRRRRWGR